MHSLHGEYAHKLHRPHEMTVETVGEVRLAKATADVCCWLLLQAVLPLVTIALPSRATASERHPPSAQNKY